MATSPLKDTSTASISRSQTSGDGIRSLADEMLRASLSRSTSSPSPTSKLTSAPTAPPPSHRLPTSILRDDLLKTGRGRPTAGNHVPVVGSSLISGTSSLNRTRKNDSSSVNTSAPRVSAAEAKSRLLQLQREVDRVKEQSPRPDTAGLFRTACSTDLLFLLDTTYSMDPYARNSFCLVPHICLGNLTVLSSYQNDARSS